MVQQDLSGRPLDKTQIHVQVTNRFLGGQSSVVVKRPHCYYKDVGSNPTTTRNKNQTLPPPSPQKVTQGSGQDLSGRKDLEKN